MNNLAFVFFAGLLCLGETVQPTKNPKTTKTPTKKLKSTIFTTISSISTSETAFNCEDDVNCDLNGTISTILPENASSPAPTSSKYEKSIPKLKNSPKSNTLDLCTCNLRLNYCDLNCCCDRDCGIEEKAVFSTCETNFFHYDTRFCNYAKNVYVNFSLERLNINQNGLLCVLKSNLPASYVIQKKKPIKTYLEAKFQQLNRKFSWPETGTDDFSEIKLNNYTYGSPVFILTENNTVVTKFQFSKGYFATNCLYQNDVTYLIDVKSKCLVTDLNENNLAIRPDIYANLIFISKPENFNISAVKTNFSKACTNNNCLKVKKKQICDQSLRNCVDFPENLALKCDFFAKTGQKQCLNCVSKISFSFFHGGKHGIREIHLKLALINVTWYSTELPSISQLFNVDFKWANRSLNFSQILSGNPGYLPGKPILFGNLVTINVTDSPVNVTSKNYTIIFDISRNKIDFRANFMTHFTEIDGKCVFTKDNYAPIEFGYNTMRKCEIFDQFEVRKNETAKKMCEKIQKIVFSYWSIADATNSTLNNILIGQFGNANSNISENWSRVLFETDLADILNQINGTLKNNVLSCFNLTHTLEIGFFHARIDFEHVLNQEKILGTVFDFKNQRNVNFELGAALKIAFRFRIEARIGFYDVTEPKLRKLVDPPSLKIRLPHDFFYPFVKLNNNGGKCACFSLLFLLFLSNCIALLRW